MIPVRIVSVFVPVQLRRISFAPAARRLEDHFKNQICIRIPTEIAPEFSANFFKVYGAILPPYRILFRRVVSANLDWHKKHIKPVVRERGGNHIFPPGTKMR